MCPLCPPRGFPSGHLGGEALILAFQHDYLLVPAGVVETIGYELHIPTFVEITEAGSLGPEIGASRARFANGIKFQR